MCEGIQNVPNWRRPNRPVAHAVVNEVSEVASADVEGLAGSVALGLSVARMRPRADIRVDLEEAWYFNSGTRCRRHHLGVGPSLAVTSILWTFWHCMKASVAISARCDPISASSGTHRLAR